MPQALAQTDIIRLRQDIEQLRRDMTDLQYAVFREEKENGRGLSNRSTITSGSVSSGGPAIARLQVRIQELSDQMRILTGQYEGVGNRLRQLESRMDKLVSDVDFRLRALEEEKRKSPVAGLTQTQMMEGNSVSLANPSPENGATEKDGNAEIPEVANGVQMAMADKTPDEQYQYAMSMLHQHDFQSAEASLQIFLKQNPNHKLVGNAMYWLGETYYARSRYEEAASVFGETYIRDRTGPKAVHSLLKLAMSLENAKQPEAACTAYRELLNKHVEAEPRILDRARAASEKLKCP